MKIRKVKKAFKYCEFVVDASYDSYDVKPIINTKATRYIMYHLRAIDKKIKELVGG